MDKPIDDKTLKNRSQQKAARVIVPLLIVSGLFWLLLNSFTASVDREDIRTAKVIKTDLKTSLTAGGTIVPISEETIASDITSNLVETFVQAGETVVKGQPLMRLDTTKLALELENMDEEIALKNNKVNASNLALARTINELKGNLELLAVDLDSRQTKLERLGQLSDIGGVSKHDLTEAELNVKRTKIEIRQLNQRIKDTEASTIADIEGLKLEQSILRKSRNDKLRMLDNATVKAPRAGLVVWMKTEEGSAINAGESLIKIADTREYKIEATVSDFYASQLWQGMPAEFVYGGATYFGTLSSVIGGEQQGILALAITLRTDKNSDQSKLRQKQRVDISLITGEIADALVINKGPFINGSGLKQVFKIHDGLASRIETSIGSGNKDFYQIKNGLKLGDEIIISDVAEFRNKKEVRVN